MMWLLAFLLGVVVGVAALLAIELAVFVALYRSATVVQPEAAETSEKPATSEFPEEVVSFLRNKVSNGHHEEKCVWFNVLFVRYFLELRRSDIYKEKIKRKFLVKLRQKMDKTGFVKQLDIRDISLGDLPPRIRRAQLVKDEAQTDDLEVIVDFDVVYNGNAEISLDLELSVGLFVPVTVIVSSLAGKLRVRVPRPENNREFNTTFATDPDIQFDVRWKFIRNDQEFTLFKERLHKLLISKLRLVFQETWVLPTWRFFELPMINLPSTRHPNCHCNLEPLSSSAYELDNVFPLDLIPTSENLPAAETVLLRRFTSLVKSNAFGQWLNVKNKDGALLQRQKSEDSAFTPDLYRGVVPVSCSPLFAYEVLSNPMHHQYIEERFLEVIPLKEFDKEHCIRNYAFQLSRSLSDRRDYVTLDIARKLSSSDSVLDTWSVVRRSAQVSSDIQVAFTEKEKFRRGLVYLYGYHIEAVEVDTSACNINVISQLGQNLQKLNLSWQKLLVIKQLLEKLYQVQLTNNSSSSDGLRMMIDLESLPQYKRSNSVNEYLLESERQRDPVKKSKSMDETNSKPKAKSLLPIDAENDSGASGDETENQASSDRALQQANFPLATKETYSQMAVDIVAYLMTYAHFDVTGGNAWKPVKTKLPLIKVEKKRAEDSTKLDIIRGSIVVNVPAASVYQLLSDTRYLHLQHPDYFSSDDLEVFSDQCRLIHVRFKSTIFADRDCVVVQVAEKLEIPKLVYVVVQRSVRNKWQGGRGRDDPATPCDIHIAGYYIETLDTDPVSCRVSHISQFEGHFPTPSVSFNAMKYGWVRNLIRLKMFVEDNSTRVAINKEGYSDVSIKPGDVFAWSALFKGRDGVGLLRWDFNLVKSDIRFSISYLPEKDGVEKVVLPATLYHGSHPANGNMLVSAKENSRFIVRWNNSYSKFATKDLRYMIGITYMPEEKASLEWASETSQYITGEITIPASQAIQLPLRFTGKLLSQGTVVPSELYWHFKPDAADLSFGVIFRPVEEDAILSQIDLPSSQVGAGGSSVEQSDWVVPVHKLAPSVFTSGSIPISDRPGWYILVFDNQLSKLFSRTLAFSACIRATEA